VLALLLPLAACRGTGEVVDWSTEPGLFGADPAWRAPVAHPQAPESDSPFGALLARVLSSGRREEGRRPRRVRVEPTPILGLDEVGFGMTVRW